MKCYHVNIVSCILFFDVCVSVCLSVCLSEPWLETLCCGLLGKTLNSHSGSLHPNGDQRILSRGD